MADENQNASRPLVAIAGASGFVGTFVRSELQDHFRFRGLTRSPTVAGRETDESGTEWKHCDLYSLPKVTEALEGCDYAVYLVHSMSPSSRLVQANFADLDLLLADNFIRAAEAAGVKRVVYLGGLLPEGKESISPHLKSRLEVEKALRSRTVPVVALRAGLVFGPGGSSFTMLIRLVQRLPMMILPQWVRSKTHSIDILDVVRAVDLGLSEEQFGEGTYDLGGHEPMTYRQLILETGRLLGKKVRFLDFPLNAFGLSRHWVALFGGVPTALVGPLLESLAHDLQAKPNPLLDQIKDGAVPFEESLRRSVDEEGRPRPNPRKDVQRSDRPKIKKAKQVRSVQRMPLPEGWSAEQVAKEYGEWLTKRFWGMLTVSQGNEGQIYFDWRWPKMRLLRLELTPYSNNGTRRRAFYITGGVLSRSPDPPGRLEFRIFPEEGFLVAAIHGFEPSLPWRIYSLTQAKIHLWVMRRFAKHLGKIGDSDSQ
ncbi:NAD(P)H-binding protein [Puniceicoccus vermicola]|uniref:NAD(P)H-binding protein n=1 Tax=Puniceicoccus vermicola TaxID=388746 RepID=A0A7X1B0T3_9BACT|nr:NAD(P)H-binding protein [Puniceicoccus vermicola]